MLFYYQELQVKDNDLSALPKCQTDTDNSLGVKNDTGKKIDGKKSTLVKRGSVPNEKKSNKSKPAMVQVKAPLSKVYIIFYTLMLSFLEIITNGLHSEAILRT